jgi:hypothetical protein
MLETIASRIMRTTIDVDYPILKEVKRLQRRERKSMVRLVSDVLAQSFAADARRAPKSELQFHWIARPMGAQVDLSDKHALFDAMDDVLP